MISPSPSFIFFGSSRFSVIVLEELKAAGFMPAMIVVAPDRPAGRGRVLTSPLPARWARENKIRCVQSEKLDSTFVRVATFTGVTFGILASYGRIIPQNIIDIFPRGILNIHPSLLPHYRGPSPIAAQILSDESRIGVTIILLDREMDHGPILAAHELRPLIHPWPPKACDLEEALAQKGGKLMADVIPKWLSRDISPREQDHTQATYTRKLVKRDGEISLADVAEKPRETFLKIRAYDQWPGVYFFDEKEKNGSHRRIKITDAVFANGVLTITRVIPEGRRERDYRVGRA